MIAEKILDEKTKWWGDDLPYTEILSAMQSYAYFFYWMGKEGWSMKYDGVWAKWGNEEWIRSTESDLYETYLTNSKPKE